MILGEETEFARWVGRIVMSGGMIMCGWFVMYIGGYFGTGNFQRDEVAGIRTANTLTSEEAWQVAHLRASRPLQVSAVLFFLSSVWMMAPFFSYRTASIGFYSIAIIATFTIMYAGFVGDRAAARFLRQEADETFYEDECDDYDKY